MHLNRPHLACTATVCILKISASIQGLRPGPLKHDLGDFKPKIKDSYTILYLSYNYNISTQLKFDFSYYALLLLWVKWQGATRININYSTYLKITAAQQQECAKINSKKTKSYR